MEVGAAFAGVDVWTVIAAFATYFTVVSVIRCWKIGFQTVHFSCSGGGGGYRSTAHGSIVGGAQCGGGGRHSPTLESNVRRSSLW